MVSTVAGKASEGQRPVDPSSHGVNQPVIR